MLRKRPELAVSFGLDFAVIIKKVMAKAESGWKERISSLMDYVETAETPGGGEKCLASWAFNFSSEDRERMKAEMEAVVMAPRMQEPRPRQVLHHWVMSWKCMENPAMENVKNAAREFLADMGLEKHQVVVGVHVNTENVHAHMMVGAINPETGKSWSQLDDILRAHASIAGICRRMEAEPETNAMFTWNVMEGPKPNPRYKAGRSMSFAYASPEAVKLEFPKDADMGSIKLAGTRRKGNCFYYPGERDACAIIYENKLWALNWAYRDIVAETLRLKEEYGASITIQKDLAWVFAAEKGREKSVRRRMKAWAEASFANGDVDIYTGLDEAAWEEDPLVKVRARPPSFPLEIRALRHRRNPIKYWNDIRQRYAARGVPKIRLDAICALHMRAHAFPRQEIELCVRNERQDIKAAKHICRWLYSVEGNMELFRQTMQGTLFMEKPESLKKEKSGKKKKKALRISHSGDFIPDGAPDVVPPPGVPMTCEVEKKRRRDRDILMRPERAGKPVQKIKEKTDDNIKVDSQAPHPEG